MQFVHHWLHTLLGNDPNKWMVSATWIWTWSSWHTIIWIFCSPPSRPNFLYCFHSSYLAKSTLTNHIFLSEIKNRDHFNTIPKYLLDHPALSILMCNFPFLINVFDWRVNQITTGWSWLCLRRECSPSIEWVCYETHEEHLIRCKWYGWNAKEK